MASKYDEFWNDRIDNILDLFNQVNQIGKSNNVDVAEIAKLGKRDSWYGLAILKGNKIVNKKPMAHIKSLVNLIRDKNINENKDIYYNINISNNFLLKIVKMKWKAHRQAGAISYEEVAILEELLPTIFSYIEKKTENTFYDEEIGKWINNNIVYLHTYIEDRGKKIFQERFPHKHIINIRNCLYHLSAPVSFWIETIDPPNKKIVPLEKISNTYYRLKENWREIINFEEKNKHNKFMEYSVHNKESDVITLSSIEEAKDKVLRSIVERRGQAEFRRSLIMIYKSICAITGCDLEDALEAAHIIPYAGYGTNLITNGILLRADIHTLFDLLLLSINPSNYKVVLSSKLKYSSYKHLDGIEIDLPYDEQNYPNIEALQYHFDEFIKLNK